ncbi:branched-chain amino acid ABC transporter permease [Azorhizobium oxalatiphilum]|uniref:Branched-chain amino acid ABC transporter permease n=1 Tax=Azorhizobium oxalatiphilum TaxID=980631 RepID=A0A917F7S3_9HYPH|nr:branched-chain amino acid ABC transporter permease [Azorhizobium oxalatiphilum]GGF58447.1 branched-chain amino acid ABC transporter permease [Azorhizobium oxalatiphilum]
MAQLLFNGLVTGLLIALPALSLSLTFSVLRFANYAIGAQITLGAYAVYLFNVPLGWPLLLSTAAGMVLAVAVGLLVQALAYEPLRARSSVTRLVASIGVALALENVVRFFAGNSPRGYGVEIARPLRIAGLRINQEQITIMLSVLVALVLVWVVFRFTRLGRAMRAVADDADLAAVRGIRRGRVVAMVWVLASALATLAGVLIGLDATLDPQMGWNYVLPVFTAAILGGIANPMAAVAGALTLGIASELATLVMAPHYRAIVAFLVMAVLLLVRPSGLFGKQWVAK